LKKTLAGIFAFVIIGISIFSIYSFNSKNNVSAANDSYHDAKLAKAIQKA
jgi:hypothetical protein